MPTTALEFMKAAHDTKMGHSQSMTPGASSGAKLPTQTSGKQQGQKTPPSSKSKDGFPGKSKKGGNTKKVTSNSNKKAPAHSRPSMAAVAKRLSNKSANLPKSTGKRTGILSKFEGMSGKIG